VGLPTAAAVKVASVLPAITIWPTGCTVMVGGEFPASTVRVAWPLCSVALQFVSVTCA
jgi:hypothetical protein